MPKLCLMVRSALIWIPCFHSFLVLTSSLPGCLRWKSGNHYHAESFMNAHQFSDEGEILLSHKRQNVPEELSLAYLHIIMWPTAPQCVTAPSLSLHTCLSLLPFFLSDLICSVLPLHPASPPSILHLDYMWLEELTLSCLSRWALQSRSHCILCSSHCTQVPDHWFDWLPTPM